MVEKNRVEVECFGGLGGEGLHAEDFGRVVTAGVKVEAQFLCHGEMMLAQFTGDEGVDSVGEEVRHGALSTSGQEGDAFRVVASVFNCLVGFGKVGLEFLGEFAASAFGRVGNNGDVLTFVGKKGVDRVQAKGFGKEGVVADFGVAIEREVGAVNGEVVVEGEFDFSEGGAAQGNRGVPEESVVADQVIGSRIDGGLKGGGARVDAGGDFFNGAIVFDLESVVGAIEIADFRASGAGVAEGNDFLKGGHNVRVRMAGQLVKCFLASKFYQEQANCKKDVGL